MAFTPTEDAAFNTGLRSAVDAVFDSHPGIDHRAEWPWMYGCLGDPSSPVWFLAENPSITQMGRIAEPDPERQWSVSPGDKLFRRALVRNGFKTGDPLAPGGWRCYITDISKSPVVVSDWHGSEQAMKDAVFDWWAPVLRYELEHGAPRLLVLMGGNTRDQVNRLRLAGRIPRHPPSVTITPTTRSARRVPSG